MLGYNGLTALKACLANYPKETLMLPRSPAGLDEETFECLRRLGLVYRTRTGIEIDVALRRLIRTNREERLSLKEMQRDYDLAGGILDRYGMLPEEDLRKLLSRLTGDEWTNDYLW